MHFEFLPTRSVVIFPPLYPKANLLFCSHPLLVPVLVAVTLFYVPVVRLEGLVLERSVNGDAEMSCCV